jgi:hypothetical protein
VVKRRILIRAEVFAVYEFWGYCKRIVLYQNRSEEVDEREGESPFDQSAPQPRGGCTANTLNTLVINIDKCRFYSLSDLPLGEHMNTSSGTMPRSQDLEAQPPRAGQC